uniref:Uncharacterized protein LOC104227279 n=1 Tax=Nicotiana sylvestris TaxID=4096 RepID=A0A1U7WT00_NICSY|nr:PREDICTED: uncharacterized protein LOC104227279 [Nicotiana sylvestris]
MTTNVYNPHVEGQQNSACRLKLIKGANMIQVGWRVDPTLYCNNATRFFIHFQDGENACFNLLCPAFVLVNPGVAIDGAFDIVSQRGGKVYEIGLSINWDQNEGNWWLFYTETNTPICFWPREVFDDFDYFATSVKWGGVETAKISNCHAPKRPAQSAPSIFNKMIMNRKIIIQQLLLLLFLCLSYDGVRGTKLSDKQEDLELERQLKRLNKPAIKTITTEYGDIYDCVDFYKQPAFDHPLLKNHNYHPQMKPSSYVKESDSTTSTSNELPRIRLPEGGCPVGTVPIRRTTKEDLIRHKLLPPPEDIMVDNPLIHREISIDSKKRRYKPLQGYKLAIIHTEDNPSNKFGGGAMTTSIYNPHVEGQQHSACRLKIVKGPNIIQVGWRVDPTLYGDNATRLYIHFQDGKNACFNLLCPAFVLVNREIVVDGALYPVSQRGGKLFETKLSINWVFDDFDYYATSVQWGGVVYSPPGIREPPMGSGFFPIRNTLYDAFCRNITLLSDKGDNINVGQLPTYVNNPNLYNAIDIPNGGDYFKHVMVYGGPGEHS